MSRPTTSDIARVAGVSLATVDRVLNQRPGVSDTTIARVNEAVTSLGYVRDVAAANLARQRQYRFLFVLPDEEGQFQSLLRVEVERNAERLGAERQQLQTAITPARDPHALVNLLATLTPDNCDGVAIMAPETPPLRDSIKRLTDAGVAVVALVTDLPSTSRHFFTGIDNVAAGRTASVLMGRFIGPRNGTILVVAGSMLDRSSIDRRLGFDQVMQQRFPQLDVLPSLEGHSNPQTTERVISQALDHSEPVGVYVVGSGNRSLARALRQRGLLKPPDVQTPAGNSPATVANIQPPARAEQPEALSAGPDDLLNPPVASTRTTYPVLIGHELTPHNRQALYRGEMDAVINQNAGHLVRSALRVLRAYSDRSAIDPTQERIRIEIVLKENLVVADDQASVCTGAGLVEGQQQDQREV